MRKKIRMKVKINKILRYVVLVYVEMAALEGFKKLIVFFKILMRVYKIPNG